MTDTVKQQLEDAIKAAGYDDSYFSPAYRDDMPDWTVEEENGWTQDRKYQHCTTIVRHTPSGRCFEVDQSRSGSYHTDWNYNPPDLGHEVRLVEKTVVTKSWEPVK